MNKKLQLIFKKIYYLYLLYIFTWIKLNINKIKLRIVLSTEKYYYCDFYLNKIGNSFYVVD